MNPDMHPDVVRRCPSCETLNAPEVMRCRCGALLAGVDLVSRQALESATVPAPAVPAQPAAAEAAAAAPCICPFEDCAQPNPPGSTRCVYCDRAFAESASLSAPGQPHSLITLPERLRERYHILSPLPTQGAEAELLLVQAHGGGPTRVAKIYRHGIVPKTEVQARIARIDPHHRVEVLEYGVSSGHAYELMEYCMHGSLRQRMQDGPLPHARLLELVHELSLAIAGVHAVGLIHRDLKPENILVRAEQPLDLALTDFGISSVLDATQRFTGTARTLPYAAPESLSGVIDGKADYWALGMVVLECLLGQHPFRGLSEAVILHHLTTRAIDLSGVTDPYFRKLLRGLLQRDPKLRWGAQEVARWQARDPALADPAEHPVSTHFREPYHLAQDICHTTEQLAVALTRHWREGVADIGNGLLLAWFRDVQKDQNAVRLLLDMRYEKQMTADAQLLQLILHLAPGIPPVWRGESIELPAILARANLALKGDAPSAQWLHDLYQHRVLEAYADVGNQQAASIVQKWGAACDQFASAWDAGLALIQGKAPKLGPDEFANFDQLMYGKNEPDRPSLSSMHARLLAIAYDPRWSERLRKRLGAELAGLRVYCPWLGDLGEAQTMSAASLLVLESLLPEARKVAERQARAIERARAAAQQEVQTLKGELLIATEDVRQAAQRSMLAPLALAELRSALDHFLDLSARIKAAERADANWQAIHKSASRTLRSVRQLSELVDRLAEHRAVSIGWLSGQVLIFALLALLLLPLFLGNSARYVLMVACGAIVLWRVLPMYWMMREIRNLADRL